jgi:hypothetical protein
MAVTVAGAAFMMYPILMQDADSKVKEGLSLWYVGSRITEGAIFVVAVLGLLSLLALSKELASEGGSGASGLQAAGTVMWNAYTWASILAQTVFCVGAVMLYYLLYVSRRVPRWLSIWGLIAAPLMLIAGLSFAVTGDPNSAFSSVLYAPLGLQEMVLAAWLIARGFNPPADRGLEVCTGTPDDARRPVTCILRRPQGRNSLSRSLRSWWPVFRCPPRVDFLV